MNIPNYAPSKTPGSAAGQRQRAGRKTKASRIDATEISAAVKDWENKNKIGVDKRHLSR